MALSDTLLTLSNGYQTVIGGSSFTFGDVTYTISNLNALRLLMARYKLAAVDEAIDTILLGAQSYSMEGRSFTRADLNTLQNFKQKLLDEIASRSNTRPIVKTCNFSGMAYYNQSEVSPLQ